MRMRVRSCVGVGMDGLLLIGLWAWATLILMLIVTNILNPGQISAAIPEAGWVLLLIGPTIAGGAWLGDVRDRVAAALLLLLPLPWLFKPIDVVANRHRTEYYDTYAVMASASFGVLQARVVAQEVDRRRALGTSLVNNIL